MKVICPYCSEGNNITPDELEQTHKLFHNCSAERGCGKMFVVEFKQSDFRIYISKLNFKEQM